MSGRAPNPSPNPTGQRNPVPFIWSVTDGIQEVALPVGARFGAASAINDRGEVAGWFQPAGGHVRAFIWSRDLGFRVIPQVVQTEENMWATDINDLGQVTGTVSFAWDEGVSFVWAEGQAMTKVSVGGADIMANGINNKGEVVGQKIYQYGSMFTPSVAHEAFVWDAANGFRSVGVSEALSIFDRA